MSTHNSHVLKLAAAAVHPRLLQDPRFVQDRIEQSRVLLHRAVATKLAVQTSAPVAGASAAVPTLPLSAAAVGAQRGLQVNDPINGPFLGGVPTPLPDVPITGVFLVLFAIGAYVHFSIYRSNSKRGHKFLLSDLIFDFCLVRVATCILRIIWAFITVREVIWMAVISQNAGAVIGFNVNLFFTQRIIRSMHPSVGWHPVSNYILYFFFASVPTIGLTDAITTIVSFYSAGNASQLQTTERILKFGASWTLALCLMPLVFLFLCVTIPGPTPERFGTGRLRNKLMLLALSSSTLGVGAIIRLDAVFNPRLGFEGSALFSKPTLYIAGFTLELVTVAAYAYFRVDLLFHVPNGAKKRGDYEAGQPGSLATFETKMRQMVDEEADEYETQQKYGLPANTSSSFHAQNYNSNAPKGKIKPGKLRVS
ncbi:hypothetical protein HIM_01494 [Hirsutella minnesotensis 3608]|nr:hypothetical protein HIM_01494 [Hirsutella minnesotensis 3608]